MRVKLFSAILSLSWPLAAWAQPSWDGQTLSFRDGSNTVAVTALSDDVFRVRLARGAGFGRDHSYALATPPAPSAHASAKIDAAAPTISTPHLNVTVRLEPFRIQFADRQGMTLDEDAAGVTFQGAAFRVHKRLPSDAHIYGLGEKAGRLDKRGWQLGGAQCVMWNTDTYGWDSSTDPLYVSVPFYVSLRGGKAHGIFLDNTWRSVFDLGRDAPDELSFGAAGGEVNYYFINGPAPKQVIERYTALTGRVPLPPLWALGYHQCRYSYYPDARVRRLAADFRQKNVPADALWLDIHYLDNYRPFTWDHSRFPDLAGLTLDLARQGLHLVTIVDPHPARAGGYAPYDSGLAKGFFVKNPAGAVYTGNVWPSQAAFDPEPSVFPDFTSPAARAWWGALHRGLLDAGVAGIWNDMDEPSVFGSLRGTMPDDLRLDNEGLPASEAELHNVYGQQMTRATYDGLRALRPNQRPFVLTRSSFAGGQRYAALWTGDALSDWASMRQSVSTLLGLGVSGFGFVGADVGGFVHAAPAELFTRWLQLSVFYPFMRTHTDLPNPDKEPWSFGPPWDAVNKRAIELRYELLPSLYNAFHQAAETGLPPMRPLFVEFPDDEAAAIVDDEFMFGPDLLAAPVLWEGQTDRPVYLPRGKWRDYWTGRAYDGPATINLPAKIDTIPLFVRAGAFIFRQAVIQHTGQMPGNSRSVLIAPAAESRATLYEDDGATLDYTRGQFATREFTQRRQNNAVRIEVAAAAGPYRPPARSLELDIWADGAPTAVLLATAEDSPRQLPHRDDATLRQSAEGWAFIDHTVVVKVRDQGERFRFTIQD